MLEPTLSGRLQLAAFIGGIVAFSLIFHLSALSGWWLNDDPQVVVHALEHTPSEILFSPSAWRYLSSSNFTPLVTISFDADLAAAGFDPGFFYAHQVAMITAIAVLLFIYLSSFSGRAIAFAAAVTFLASPAAVIAARNLMTRHYVEGAVLSLAALLAWRRAGESGKAGLGWSLIAAIAYLAAMSAKEVYAPLPLLMILEAELLGTRRGRTFRRLIPCALAAGLYVYWRMFMLGSLGGYGSLSRAGFSWLPQTWSVPLLLKFMVAAIAITLLIGNLIRRPAPTLLVVALAGTFALLPLMGVTDSIEPRHLFAPLIVAIAASAAGATLVRSRVVLVVAASIVLCAIAFLGFQQKQSLETWSVAMTTEGRYVWDQPATAPALLADSPGWYLGGLRSMRRYAKRGESPRYILSKFPLDAGEVDPAKVVTLGPSNRMGPISPVVAEKARRQRALIDDRHPMRIRIRWQDNVMTWRLSYGGQAGRWTFLTYPEYDDFPMHSAGFRRLPAPAEKQFFRIAVDLPSGAWSISPVFELPVDATSIDWSRTPEEVQVTGR